MLLISFSIGVNKDQADEMRDIITNKHDIKITHESVYDETDFLGEQVSLIYFECYASLANLESLANYLDHIWTGTAIFTY